MYHELETTWQQVKMNLIEDLVAGSQDERVNLYCRSIASALEPILNHPLALRRKCLVANVSLRSAKPSSLGSSRFRYSTTKYDCPTRTAFSGKGLASVRLKNHAAEFL